MKAKIELKGPTGEGCPDSTVPTLELVKEMGMFDQVSFSSFVHSRLQLIRQLYPERSTGGQHVVKTGALFEGSLPPQDYIEQCLTMGATEVHLQYDAMNEDRVEAIRSAGMQSMAWLHGPVTMLVDGAKWIDAGNEDENMFRVIGMTGVDEICCNKPDVLAAVRRKQLMEIEMDIFNAAQAAAEEQAVRDGFAAFTVAPSSILVGTD